MDLDIEMDYVEAAPVAETYEADILVGDDQEPGEVEDTAVEDSKSDERTLVPNKIHIQGLDTFNPDDVKAYVAEHFSAGRVERVEWIDDSSANLIFSSESTAHEALIALASVEIADATQLPLLENISAKTFSSKPDSHLLVRPAVTGDRKAAGAAQRSRFYLFNPEYDPEERRRRGEFMRSKYRERDGYGRRDGRRRDDRRDEEEPEPFDVNLYDDDEEALAKRANTKTRPARRDSRSSEEDDRFARQNRGKELFPNLKVRDRDARARSASPGRDESRMEVDDLARDREAALQNRDKARAIKDRLSKDNRVKELFPTKVVSSAPGSKAQMDQVDNGVVLSSAKLADRITSRPTDSDSTFQIRGTANKRGSDMGLSIKGTGGNVKELFPDKFSNAGKELFGDKLDGRGRRRQKAEDSFY